MKIAIPTANGQLCQHFGHADNFVLLEADKASNEVTSSESLVPPPHEPGVLPSWLAQLGAQVIIAGGMGQRAQQMFVEKGIEVLVGAPVAAPEELAKAYLAGSLSLGSNICDH